MIHLEFILLSFYHVMEVLVIFWSTKRTLLENSLVYKAISNIVSIFSELHWLYNNNIYFWKLCRWLHYKMIKLEIYGKAILKYLHIITFYFYFIKSWERKKDIFFNLWVELINFYKKASFLHWDVKETQMCRCKAVCSCSLYCLSFH